MKISKDIFIDEWSRYEPLIRDHISNEGKEHLFKYLEELDELSLDIICLCCGFSECPEDECDFEHGNRSIAKYSGVVLYCEY